MTIKIKSHIVLNDISCSQFPRRLRSFSFFLSLPCKRVKSTCAAVFVNEILELNMIAGVCVNKPVNEIE